MQHNITTIRTNISTTIMRQILKQLYKKTSSVAGLEEVVLVAKVVAVLYGSSTVVEEDGKGPFYFVITAFKKIDELALTI